MKKKGSALAEVIELEPKGKSEDVGEADDDMDEEDVAADELMDALGVPEDKRSDVKQALESYVSLCLDKRETEGSKSSDDKY